MTTIAWDGTTMASDGASSYGNAISRPVRKVFPIKVKATGDRFIIGYAGLLNLLRPTIAYIMENTPKGEWPRFDEGTIRAHREMKLQDTSCAFYLVNRENVCYQYDDWMSSVKRRRGFCALGSGMDFAIGAMATGAPAVQAVRTAIEYDTYSDLPTFALTFEALERMSSEQIITILEQNI